MIKRVNFIFRVILVAICYFLANTPAEARWVKLSSLVDLHVMGEDAQGMDIVQIEIPDEAPSQTGRYNRMRRTTVQYRYNGGIWKNGRVSVEYAKDLSFVEVSIYDSFNALQRVYSITAKGKTSPPSETAVAQKLPDASPSPVSSKTDAVSVPSNPPAAEPPASSVERTKPAEPPMTPRASVPAVPEVVVTPHEEETVVSRNEKKKRKSSSSRSSGTAETSKESPRSEQVPVVAKAVVPPQAMTIPTVPAVRSPSGDSITAPALKATSMALGKLSIAAAAVRTFPFTANHIPTYPAP